MKTPLKALAATLLLLSVSATPAGAGALYSGYAEPDGWVLAKCEQGLPPGDRTTWTEAHWDTFYACLKLTVPPKVAAAPPTRTYTPAEEPQGIIRYTPGRPIIALVKLNGRTTARLILDTGADDTTIRPQILTAAGVDLDRPVGYQQFRGVGPGVHSAPLAYVDSIEVAGVSVRMLKVSAYAINNSADGLLGRDFLDRFKVVVDPAAGVVTLVPR